MARRIRPKVRDKPKPVRDKKGRIKIRMRRESSDLLQLALASAQKEARKEAGFKGFKSGVKSATNKAKKAKETLLREIDRERELHRLATARADILTRAIERCVMAGHVSCDQFAQNGVTLERYKNRRENMYRWRVTWDTDTPATNAAVVRDVDGVDRVQTVMQRHRLHPGTRIRVADMAVIWASVTDAERPTIDPMQGMRGTWYWNARRYSSHSSAMNAWRRVMHNRANALVPGMTDEELEFVESSVERQREVDQNRMAGVPDEPTEDDLEEADSAPTAFADEDEDEEYPHEFPVARTRNMHAESSRVRNRVNLFLRSVSMRSCSYWERNHRQYVAPIMARNDQAGRQDETGLSAWGHVCAAFAVPLRHWDEESFQSFCARASEYLEQTQNGAEHNTAGLLP